MESIQKRSDYSEYYRRVVRWNELAKQKKVFSSVDRENQAKLVREEVEEMFEAYDLGREDDFYKELADVFVVASFYDYLLHGTEFECGTVFSNHIEFILDDLDTEDLQEVFFNTMRLMNSVNKSPEEYLVPVLDSNDSKFFPEEDSNVELEYAQAAYSGRYQGIAVYPVGDGLAVLRDKNNKILKPSSYKEWSEFI